MELEFSVKDQQHRLSVVAHELVRGIENMATAISYKLFGEQSS